MDKSNMNDFVNVKNWNLLLNNFAQIPLHTIANLYQAITVLDNTILKEITEKRYIVGFHNRSPITYPSMNSIFLSTLSSTEHWCFYYELFHESGHAFLGETASNSSFIDELICCALSLFLVKQIPNSSDYLQKCLLFKNSDLESCKNRLKQNIDQYVTYGPNVYSDNLDIAYYLYRILPTEKDFFDFVTNYKFLKDNTEQNFLLQRVSENYPNLFPLKSFLSTNPNL